MKIFKKLTVVAAAATLLFAISACANGSSNSDSDDDKKKPDTTQTTETTEESGESSGEGQENGSGEGENQGGGSESGQEQGNEDPVVNTANSAVYKGTGINVIPTISFSIVFNEDNTFSVNRINPSSPTEIPFYQGVYTGDPSKDGTIKITFTKKADGPFKLGDYTDPEPDKEITITDGQFNITVNKLPVSCVRRVASFIDSQTPLSGVYSMNFYADSTFERRKLSDNENIVNQSGTYTVDPNDDTLIHLTIMKEYNGTELKDCDEPYTQRAVNDCGLLIKLEQAQPLFYFNNTKEIASYAFFKEDDNDYSLSYLNFYPDNTYRIIDAPSLYTTKVSEIGSYKGNPITDNQISLTCHYLYNGLLFIEHENPTEQTIEISDGLINYDEKSFGILLAVFASEPDPDTQETVFIKFYANNYAFVTCTTPLNAEVLSEAMAYIGNPVVDGEIEVVNGEDKEKLIIQNGQLIIKGDNSTPDTIYTRQ